MRRSILSLACLAFALSLHASVPSASSAAKFNPAAPGIDDPNPKLGHLTHSPHGTVSPFDTISFYLEFYGDEPARVRAPRKPGLFHRLAGAVMRTVHKAIPN